VPKLQLPKDTLQKAYVTPVGGITPGGYKVVLIGGKKEYIKVSPEDAKASIGEEFTQEELNQLESTGQTLGSHGSPVFKHKKTGQRYLFKHVNKKIARAEEVTSKLGAALLPGQVQFARYILLGNQHGALIRMREGWKPIGKEASSMAVSASLRQKFQKHFDEIVQHHVFDWMISQHDSHGENIGILDGHIHSIDKGQAWRFLGQDKLPVKGEEATSGANPNPSKQVYSQFWKAYHDGQITGDPVAAASVVFSRLKGLSEEDIKDLIEPYVKAAAGKTTQANLRKRILDRIKESKSNWEWFLGKEIPTTVEAAVAGQTPGTTKKTPVPKAKTPPVKLQTPETAEKLEAEKDKKDALGPTGAFIPVKKGTATLINPGGPVKSFGANYPGVGFDADVTYKKKKFNIFFMPSGMVRVTYPDGTMKEFTSPNAACDSLYLWTNGLDLDMTAAEKKKKGISYSATKMLKLKEFGDSLKPTGTITPPPKMKSLLEMVLDHGDGVVSDMSIVPTKVQEVATALGSQIVIWDNGGEKVFGVSYSNMFGNPSYIAWPIDNEKGNLGSQFDAAASIFKGSPIEKQAVEVTSGPPLQATGDGSSTVKKPVDAPKVSNSPLPEFTTVTVKKKFTHAAKKLPVKLNAQADGFNVQLPGADMWHAFDSLSAASDFVWVVQKGYENVEDYKAKTGKSKVPSGGGWKFWGLKPSEDNFETMPESSGPSGEEEPKPNKNLSLSEVKNTPVGGVYSGEPGYYLAKVAANKWQMTTGGSKIGLPLSDTQAHNVISNAVMAYEQKLPEKLTIEEVADDDYLEGLPQGSIIFFNGEEFKKQDTPSGPKWRTSTTLLFQDEFIEKLAMEPPFNAIAVHIPAPEAGTPGLETVEFADLNADQKEFLAKLDSFKFILNGTARTAKKVSTGWKVTNDATGGQAHVTTLDNILTGATIISPNAVAQLKGLGSVSENNFETMPEGQVTFPEDEAAVTEMLDAYPSGTTITYGEGEETSKFKKLENGTWESAITGSVFGAPGLSGGMTGDTWEVALPTAPPPVSQEDKDFGSSGQYAGVKPLGVDGPWAKYAFDAIDAADGSVFGQLNFLNDLDEGTHVSVGVDTFFNYAIDAIAKPNGKWEVTGPTELQPKEITTWSLASLIKYAGKKEDGIIIVEAKPSDFASEDFETVSEMQVNNWGFWSTHMGEAKTLAADFMDNVYTFNFNTSTYRVIDKNTGAVIDQEAHQDVGKAKQIFEQFSTLALVTDGATFEDTKGYLATIQKDTPVATDPEAYPTWIEVTPPTEVLDGKAFQLEFLNTFFSQLPVGAKFSMAGWSDDVGAVDITKTADLLYDIASLQGTKKVYQDDAAKWAVDYADPEVWHKEDTFVVALPGNPTELPDNLAAEVKASMAAEPIEDVVTKMPSDMSAEEKAAKVKTKLTLLEAFDHLDFVKSHPEISIKPSKKAGLYNIVTQASIVPNATGMALLEELAEKHGIQKKFKSHPNSNSYGAFLTIDETEAQKLHEVTLPAGEANPVAAKNNFETMPDVQTSGPSGKKKLLKTIAKSLSVKKKLEKLGDLPAGTQVAFGDGSKFIKLSDGSYQSEGSNVLPDGVIYTDFSVAQLIGMKGGCKLLPKGSDLPGVLPKSAPTEAAPTKNWTKPEDPEKAKKILWAKAWKAPDVETTRRVPYLVQKAGLQPEDGLYVREQKDGYVAIGDGTEETAQKLLGAATEGGIQKTPFGLLFVLSTDDLKKSTPNADTITGPDGNAYPHGTVFEEEKVYKKLVEKMTEETVGKVAPYMGPLQGMSHTYKVLKSSPDAEQKAKEIQSKYGIDVALDAIQGIGSDLKVGNKYIMFPIPEAKANENSEDFEVKTIPKEPPKPEPIKLKSLGILSGPANYGQPFPVNRDDLSNLSELKPGRFGNFITMGKGHVYRRGGVEVYKVKTPDGKTRFRIVGELNVPPTWKSANWTETKVAFNQAGKPHSILGDWAPENNFDADTGTHIQDTDLAASFNSKRATLSDGKSTVTTFTGLTWKRHFMVEIEEGADAEQALADAVKQFGIDVNDAMATPDENDRRVVIKQQLLQNHHGPNGRIMVEELARETMGYTLSKPSSWEETLDTKLKGKIKKTDIDSARVVVGANGKPQVISNDLDPVLGLDKTVWAIGTALSKNGAVNMLMQGGYTGQEQRLFTGNSKYIGNTTSGTSDMTCGGGVGFFARVVNTSNKSISDSYGAVKALWHPRIARQTNWHINDADGYGMQTPNGPGTWKPRVRKNISGQLSGSNEFVVEDTDNRDLVGLLCNSDDIRDFIISKAKEAGVTELNGKPLEEVILTKTSTYNYKDDLEKLELLKEPLDV
jgi:hypothetical protein